ncbi:MAG: DNA polymerase Y family protein [Phenylobacterium sp.]|uniref:DNA polymerase Y family protein n=1 Tax=Phenylobacterium sp. TaxID=1871053 RepID=UPI002A36AED6|nr:DNA polymerase Y family protein [Phenylobacterium sp.]MDX9998857.1 DNA polymerase Y family protein [Phenylobacterium sp.]
MGRILCAWSPNWAIESWRRRNSAAAPEAPPPAFVGEGDRREAGVERDCGAPFALVETVRGVRRLAAVDAAAVALGLYPGQKGTDALALAPDLAVAELEPEADARALTALVDWCVRFSPAAAADPPDGLFLDVSGLAHLWGGEAALVADFKARLARNGLTMRCAVADTPGAAWALAHFGRDGTIVPPGGQAGLLAPLPPAALRLEPQTAAQLERLGLKRLEQLFALPRAPFAKRFGAEALRRLDQALGRAEEALAFRRPPTPWLARLAFAEPVSAPEDLARVAFDVAEKLCARLEREGRGARRFELAFHRLDGCAVPLRIGLSVAGRDPARIARLFAPKLETVDPGFGIEVVTLAAEGVEPIGARQVRLDAARDDGEGLAPLIDRLVNRLGEARVWKAVPVESHVPELAAGRAEPLAPVPPARPWDPEQPRPVRLFRRPEPIEAMAPIPDDPPVQFRWRGRLRRVRRAEGPERIAEEWWKRPIEEAAPSRVRDYYRVEDEDGARYWLFRAGLYEPGQPAKWWLHGLFG